jgi:ABC-type transport system involved in cytochrome c biogenesis permease subunit
MIGGLSGYELEVFTVGLLLGTAALYALGLMEGRAGECAFAAGLALHALSIAHRATVIGGIPLTEKHDTISFMAMATGAIYLVYRRKGARDLTLSALPLTVVLVLVASAHRTIDTVSPFMETPWFAAHTFFYFLSYAFFGISALIGASFVLGGPTGYERLEHLTAVSGWIALSISLFAGSVWFYVAYGTYWLWTAKELWITVTWLYYGLYLHARLVPGLRGRPAAAIGSLGYALALFTYFGVGTIIKAPPTQF